MAVTTSRVLDTRKAITSRSGADKASKAMDSLQTAEAILRASGQPLKADMLQPEIALLQRQISTYYRSLPRPA